MRSSRWPWSALPLLGLVSGCTFEELPSDEVCRDVGYSIANRVLVCTGDRELSEQRYDEYLRSYSCRVFPANRDRIEDYYACPVAVRRVSCEVVTTDLDAWLAPLPHCGDILEHADGTPLQGDAVDAGADADAEPGVDAGDEP